MVFIHNLVTPYYLKYQKVIHTEGKVILDAGCGTGYKCLVLAEANPGAKLDFWCGHTNDNTSGVPVSD